jgi:DNA polymerase-1
VAFDLETDQVVWYDTPDAEADRILMLGMAWEKSKGVIISPDLLYENEEAREVLNEFFSRPDLRFVAHNGKFDVTFLRTVDIFARVDFDTMLAHYALWEESGGHGLKQLALEYYGLEDYERDLVQLYLKSRNDYYSKVPYEKLAQYCAWDVCVTRELSYDLEEEMKKENVLEMFEMLLMPMQEALTEVEWTGIPIDREHTEEWQEKLFDHCDQLEAEMGEIADDPLLNPRSPLQVSNVIYNIRGLPRPRVRGVKPNSTAKKALMHIKPGQDEFIDKLRDYRRVHKINRSYLKNILKFADVNDRVHPSALIHGTEIGRLAYRNPAIQTIPRPYEDMFGAIVRSAFVAPLGHKFIIADYSQAELRVTAILSGDPFLLSVYRDGRDLHTEVAIEMYGDDFTDAQRVLTKMFNFSYIYGGSEYSFAEDAGLPIDIARRFVADYNAIMPVLSEYRAKQLAEARKNGFVVSPFGRKRRFPLITQQNLSDVRKASMHAPIAGTASDLTQLSLISALHQGHKVVLTVHDSIGEITREEEAEYMAGRLRQIMIDTADYYFPQVPWEVDVDIRDRWCPIPEEIYGEEVRATFG